MSDDFDLEILHRGGTYLIVARAFGVAVRNRDLQAGVKETLQRVAEVQEMYREAGLEPKLSQGWRPRRLANFLRARESQREEAPSPRMMDSVLPALVSGVVLATFILLATVPLFSVLARLNRTLQDATSVASGTMINGLGRSAIDVLVKTGDAMDKVTPQRKEELRQAVRRIMKGLEPIIEEVGDSREPKPPTAPPTR